MFNVGQSFLARGTIANHVGALPRLVLCRGTISRRSVQTADESATCSSGEVQRTEHGGRTGERHESAGEHLSLNE